MIFLNFAKTPPNVLLEKSRKSSSFCLQKKFLENPFLGQGPASRLGILPDIPREKSQNIGLQGTLSTSWIRISSSRYPSSSDGDSQELHETGSVSVQGKHILTERSLEVVSVPSHDYRLEYSVLSQRGYYPDTPDKENQDSFCIRTQIQGDPSIHFFGVFDGHGQYGAECSNFVRERLVETLSNDSTLLDDPVKAFSLAFSTTNRELHESKIDDSSSGTTAITVLLIGETLLVANVGDSRAVIGVKEGNQIVAEDLSHDQTPFRKDEYKRVKLCGARVLSVDQVEGLKDPDVQSWGDEESQGGDPPRLWVQGGMYPGTAFTRSVGDSIAEGIGVIAEPEVSMIQLTPNHLFFIVASDGVFEFLSSQTVVDMVSSYTDPRDACSAIAGESYKLWLENENRTDDITIMIVHIKGLSNSGAAASAGSGMMRIRPAMPGKGTSELSSTTGGSDIYRSARSEFADLPTSHRVALMNWSPAIVVPSPTHHRPLEVVGH